jgi:hypothetical protein
MARPRSFTQEQVDIVARAVNVHGTPARTVAAQAAAGELGPSFNISPSSVVTYAREDRLRREERERVQDTPHREQLRARGSTLDRRLFGVLEQSLDEIELEDPIDLGKVRQWITASRSARGLPTRGGHPAGEPPASEPEQESNDLLARLAAKAERDALNGNGNSAED